MPDLGQGDPTLVLGAIAVLLTALGLSSASGLRAYFPLLGVALGSDIATPDGAHLIILSKPFQSLGEPWLIALLAVLALGEFAVDKIPGLDHASDLIHTLIRPVAGAVVMAGISNPLSEHDPWAAAAVGAVLAFSVHGMKAATRPVVTATTVGVGNPVLSVGEDIATLIMTLLSLLAPVLVLLFVALLLLLIGRPLVRGVRCLFGFRQAPQVVYVPYHPDHTDPRLTSSYPSPPLHPSPYPPSYPTYPPYVATAYRRPEGSRRGRGVPRWPYPPYPI
jgi:uncharacterized protein DUF4126